MHFKIAFAQPLLHLAFLFFRNLFRFFHLTSQLHPVIFYHFPVAPAACQISGGVFLSVFYPFGCRAPQNLFPALCLLRQKAEQGFPEKIPVLIPGSEVIGSLLEVGGKERRITCVSMGNPHCVIFGDDPDTIDLEREGTAVAASPIFPEGVNVEFIHLAGRNTLKMRVWERGSGETLACGTGACAAACAAVRNGLCEKGEEILVHLTGGDLRIRMTDETVWMTGGATLVFTGEVEI